MTGKLENLDQAWRRFLLKATDPIPESLQGPVFIAGLWAGDIAFGLLGKVIR